jgi:hypothetical protein
MRPYGASRVAPWVKFGLTLMNMPPRAFLVLWWGSRPRPDRGLREPGKENNKGYKSSSFGGCAVPTLVRLFSC